MKRPPPPIPQSLKVNSKKRNERRQATRPYPAQDLQLQLITQLQQQQQQFQEKILELLGSQLNRTTTGHVSSGGLVAQQLPAGQQMTGGGSIEPFNGASLQQYAHALQSGQKNPMPPANATVLQNRVHLNVNEQSYNHNPIIQNNRTQMNNTNTLQTQPTQSQLINVQANGIAGGLLETSAPMEVLEQRQQQQQGSTNVGQDTLDIENVSATRDELLTFLDNNLGQIEDYEILDVNTTDLTNTTPPPPPPPSVNVAGPTNENRELLINSEGLNNPNSEDLMRACHNKGTSQDNCELCFSIFPFCLFSK